MLEAQEVKKRLVITIAVVCNLFIFSSCVNNMSTMITDYNGNFQVMPADPEDDVIGPGDEGFSANMMLYDEYFLYEDGTLIISAPPHCSDIEWVFTDPDNKYCEVTVCLRAGMDTNGNIAHFTGTKWSGQQLILFVPESNLESPKTYKLTLTVTDEGGNTYTDTCGIVIYQRYNR